MSETTVQLADLRINGERLWHSLMTLAQIGATPKGGVARLALTDLDRQGRDLVVHWARELGLQVTVDRIGNIFMRRPGRNPALAPVMTGSHIDTQPTGGKFDGNYGVLAGLEVIRTLNDHGIETEAPLEVVVWTNEEGSRFVPVMMGSGVFAGAFTLEHAYAATDTQGLSVKNELAAIAIWAMKYPGNTRSARILKRTSSKDRYWKMPMSPSGWFKGCWVNAGSIAWCTAWRPMRAPPPWGCGAMPCKWPPS